MSRSLPPRPSLEHLKKQAKELLAAHRRNDPDAVETVTTYFAAGEKVGLTQAQLALARDYGFESWNALSRHVEDQTGSPEEFIEEALAGHIEKAKKLWHEHKAKLRKDPAAAATVGDTRALQEAVKANPEILKSKIGPKSRPILGYACFSHLVKAPEFEAGIVETVKFLLKAGADPNAYYTSTWPGHQTPLYGAAGVVNHAGLTKILLDAGADPNDGEAEGELGESVYHACDHTGHNECLRLILEAGPIQKAKDYCIKRKLDFEDPEGVLIFLESGANPNVAEKRTALSHAILRGRSIAILKLLIEHGADPNVPDDDGTTPYVMARRLARTDVAEFLETKGAKTELSLRDALQVAAAEDNVDEVKRLAREHPELIADAKSDDSWGNAMNDLARLGHTAGLEALINEGIDPGIRNAWNETPLHWAGCAGKVETVRMLLRYNPPLDLKDIHNHGTPMGYTCWASQNWIHEGADYVGCVKAFLAAGVVHDGPSGSPEVRKLLKEARV